MIADLFLILLIIGGGGTALCLIERLVLKFRTR